MCAMCVRCVHVYSNLAITMHASSLTICLVVFYLMKPFGMERLSNLFVLVSLSIGGANLLFYYQVEFAARLYCPKPVSPSPIFIEVFYSYYC